MPKTLKRKATVYIDEYLIHAVTVEIKPEWLNDDGDLTENGTAALHQAALDERCDKTIHDCKHVEVSEVEFNKE